MLYEDGTLTNIGAGDGVDPNRWGDLTTFTVNSNLTRDDWTVTNEEQFGFRVSTAQSSTLDIVLTATGDWGSGTIVIIIHQKKSTIITF